MGMNRECVISNMIAFVERFIQILAIAKRN